MGTRKGRFLLALLLGGAAAVPFAAESSADGPTIESAGPGREGYFWSPSTASIGARGTVSFRSTSTTVPHGLQWTGGPVKPSCSGVPVEAEKYDWSGSCTFAQAGSYSFVCTVHPTEMKGTVTVSAGASEPPRSHRRRPVGRPNRRLREPAARGLQAREEPARQHRFGLDSTSRRRAPEASSKSSCSPTGRSWRPGAPRAVPVGRLVRPSVGPGHVSFAVRLKPRARRVLSSGGKLAVMVEVIVKPPGQAALTLKRGVVLHV